MRAWVTRQDIIRSYNRSVSGVEKEASDDNDRAYGGVIRARKGKLVESIAPHIIQLAWQQAGGTLERLSFGEIKKYEVPIQKAYLDCLPPAIRSYIISRLKNYFFRAQVDSHVFVDKKFTMGIECKSYTENAMLKRILVDFRLLKSLYPNLVCCLLQMESMLGGSYSDPLATPQIGSPSSHTLMSYFPEIDLHILTLLDGERKVEKPIHQPEYFKELRPEVLEHTINRFSKLLKPFV